ncbi:MAG: hypothetical protein ICV85_16425 [Tolypothrix sp. T3-bin4]|nr:hypothetical protein [Tolypothrix sp. T3-bin4]
MMPHLQMFIRKGRGQDSAAVASPRASAEGFYGILTPALKPVTIIELAV